MTDHDQQQQAASSREDLGRDLMDQMGGGFSTIPGWYMVRLVLGSMVLGFGGIALWAGLSPAPSGNETGRTGAIVVGLVIISVAMAVLWTPLVWNTRRFTRFVSTLRAWLRSRRTAA